MKSRIMNMIVVGVVAMGIAGLASCAKEDKTLRTKTYTMSEYNSSGVTGTVTFNENEDNTTNVKVHMMGTVNGLAYMMHIHSGPITSPGGVVFDLGSPVSSGGMIDNTVKVSQTFDYMTTYNGCFVAHDPQASDPLTTYVLVGNVGSNAP